MIRRISANPGGWEDWMRFDLMRPFRLAGLGVVAFFLAHATPATAQEGGILAPGNAAVTGFSGLVINEAPEGDDPADYLSIDINGPAAQVVDLSTLGAEGELSQVAKPFTVTAELVGQVFGVALDNAPQPNIYLAATSAYGLSIYVPDASGIIRRVRAGAEGAQFLPGQFGPPEWGGGPGSVWRVDGVTGEVSLFATLDNAAQGVASLGGLAFDPVSQQLFVVERGSGIVYRYSLDGTQLGSYDHGTEGRPGAGLPPVAAPPFAPVALNSPSFDTENPVTWGFAPPSRRVFALAVRNNRLYYSVAQGPQVWSVGIGANGAVSAGPRMEVEVPALANGIEIASIAFDGQGRMYLAERGDTTGDYELKNLASGGQSRVLRFQPKPANDPAPGFWRLIPDQYAIGYPPVYNNADGGVALGYGYSQGTLNPNSCRAVVWSTGERLLDPGDPSAPADPYALVDGLQGNSPNLVEPQNEPPYNAWYIDYDDRPGDPGYQGYMGAIAIYSPCAQQAYQPPTPPPPPVVTCPPGTNYEGGQCVVTVTCPPGTSYKNGVCVYPTCPSGYVLYKNQCVPPPQTCPPNSYFYNGQCVPAACPPGMYQLPDGYCACPPGRTFYQGKCVPVNTCPPGFVPSPSGVCWCPQGTFYDNGVCRPNPCPQGYERINGKCIPKFCPPGYIKGPGGLCIPIFNPCPQGESLRYGKCVPDKCPAGYVRGKDGYCYPIQNPCPAGEILFKNKCVPDVCPPGFIRNNQGVCVPYNQCKPNQIIINGKCVPAECPPNTVRIPNGQCVGLGLKCPPGQKMQNGKCVAASPCPPGQVVQGGQCVVVKCDPGFVKNAKGQCVPQKATCPEGTQMVQNKCVPIGGNCKPWQQFGGGRCINVCQSTEVYQNGKCIPVGQPRPQPGIKCPPPQKLVNGQCVAPAPPPGIKCPQGQKLVNGKCVAPPPPKPVDLDCKAWQQQAGGKCVNVCKTTETYQNGKCVSNAPPPKPQPPKPQPPKPQPVKCQPPQKLVNGECVAPKPPPGIKCPQGQRLVDGECVAPKPKPVELNCKPWQQQTGGKCVNVCKSTEVYKGGQCVSAAPPKPAKPTPAAQPKCGKGQKLVDGECVAAAPAQPKCKANQELRNGKCVAAAGGAGKAAGGGGDNGGGGAPKCKRWQQAAGGKCINVCQTTEIYRNGKCVAAKG
jgi:hypothetical protein